MSCCELRFISALSILEAGLIQTNKSHNLNSQASIEVKGPFVRNAPLTERTGASVFLELVQISSRVEICLARLNLHTLYRAVGFYVAFLCDARWCFL